MELASEVVAQSEMEDKRDNLRFGLKAGINISNVNDEKGDQFVANSRTCFVGGGFISIPLNRFLGFQP